MQIGVGAIIINENNEILLQKRTNNVKVYKNCWFIPCGKAEENEPPQQALKREIKEELDVDIEIIREIKREIQVKSDNKSLLLICYLGKISQVPKNMEPEKCSELRYFFTNTLPLDTGKPVIEFLEIYKKQINNK